MILKKRKQFTRFWKVHRYDLITTLLTGNSSQKHASTDLKPYLETFSLWHKELNQGAHQATDWYQAYQTLKRATTSFATQEIPLFLATIPTFLKIYPFPFMAAIHTSGVKQKKIWHVHSIQGMDLDLPELWLIGAPALKALCLN